MQRTAFSLVVLVTLGLGGFFGLVVWQPELFAAYSGGKKPATSANTSGSVTTAFTT